MKICCCWGHSLLGCWWPSSGIRCLYPLVNAVRIEQQAKLWPQRQAERRGAVLSPQQTAGESSPSIVMEGGMMRARCSARGGRKTSQTRLGCWSSVRIQRRASKEESPICSVTITPNLRAAQATSPTQRASGNRWPARLRSCKAKCAGTSAHMWRQAYVSAHPGTRTSNWTSRAPSSPLSNRRLLHGRLGHFQHAPSPLRRARLHRHPAPDARTPARRPRSTAAARGPVCALSFSPCCKMTTASLTKSAPTLSDSAVEARQHLPDITSTEWSPVIMTGFTLVGWCACDRVLMWLRMYVNFH